MIATRITPNSRQNSSAEGDAMLHFCDKIFPNLADNIGDPNWIEGRAILAPTNKEVEMLNTKKSEQISQLGGSGGMPPGNIFLIVQNAANWAIFSFFVRPLGGGHGPPLGAAYACR